jgi:hypothetical protein
MTPDEEGELARSFSSISIPVADGSPAARAPGEGALGEGVSGKVTPVDGAPLF